MTGPGQDTPDGSDVAAATGGTGAAAAGVPGGRSPSGATPKGVAADDERTPETADTDLAGTASGATDEPQQAVGQAPGTTASPVPSPGAPVGGATPEVSAGAAASPGTGIHQGEKDPDSDAATVSPGAYVALAPAGHPDGEVDTRSR